MALQASGLCGNGAVPSWSVTMCTTVVLSSGPCAISEAVACDSDGFLFHSDLLM